MTGFQNDNPYAAPEPVEEDAPGYDLRKIARLYNRLGWVLKWFVPFLVVDMLGFAGIIVLTQLVDPYEWHSSVVLKIVYIVAICLISPVHFFVGLLLMFGAFLVERIGQAMKYRGFALVPFSLGAIIVGINIRVMNLMRSKAETILCNGGVEIINGRVDLTQIMVEEDY